MRGRGAWGIAAGLLLATAYGQTAPGQEAPLVTDRPDFTESTETIAPGRFQLEAGVTLAEAGRLDDLSLGEVLGRLGLSERLELRMGVGSYRRVDAPGGGEASGWEDSSLGVKARLAAGDGGLRPDSALILATTLPTCDRELGGGAGLQPEAVLALAWKPAPLLGLGVNVGYAYPRDGGERFHQGSGSVALGWAAGERLGLYAELFGFTEEERGGDAASYANGGATWLLGPDLQLDARLGTGLSGTDTDWFFGVGFAARW
jgi:hypothetical protein